MNKIKVIVASSSQIYALGLCTSLSEDKRIEVFNHAYKGEHVIDMAGKVNPDIVLIDSELLNYNGTALPEMLEKLYPEVKVVVLISPENMQTSLDNAVSKVVRGILPKTVSPKDLVKSIIETAGGGTAIHPIVMPQILEKLVAKLQNKPVLALELTVREREVMELVAEGKSNREIAKHLFLSENTVKGHIRRICYKLKIENRVEMARYVLINKKV